MSRRAGVAAVAGFLALGVLAAGLAAWLPESLRAAAALALVLVGPACLVERPAWRFFAGRDRGHPALRIPLAFISWLAALAVWSGVFAVAGASFHAYAGATTWLLLGFYGAWAWIGLRTRSDGNTGGIAMSRRWWVVLVACAVFAAVIPPRLTVGDDSLDHIGYVRHIVSEDSLRPAGVLAMPEGAAHAPADPRKGALHALVAFVASIAAADPIAVWQWLPVLLFPVTVLAGIAFHSAFTGSRAGRILAGAIFLLSFHGNPFRFALSSPHGENLAALWCWVVIAAVRWTNGRGRALTWALVAAGGVLVHLGVAMHVVVLVATVLGFGGAWGIGTARRKWESCAPLLAGVVMAVAFRHADIGGAVNVIHSHTQGVLYFSKRWFAASPMELLRLNGMLFLGGLVCVPALIAARARPQTRAILAAAALPFLVSFVPWIATPLFHVGSYMVFRSLLNVPVFAAVAECATGLVAGLRARERRALLFGVPALLVWLIVFVRPVPRSLWGEICSQTRGDVQDARVAVAPLVRSVEALPGGAVVLSDPATSYALSACTAHRFVAVYQQHGNPRDPFALDRLEAVRDVLSPYALPAAAAEACRHFGVNYVVINGAPPQDASRFLSVWRPGAYRVALRRMESMGSQFTRVDSAGSACIYRFDASGAVSGSWSVQDQPVRTAAPALASCALDAPAGNFRITGVSVEPSRVLPGDTVHVTLGYRRDAPSPFTLPALVYVRFDHEILCAGREYPGEKIVRRAQDARAQERSRFRADLVPGHGVYEPDLWPVGFPLCETFSVTVPPSARLGHYRVELALVTDSLLPNFHVRDLLFNRDHYSGLACASLDVVDRVTGTGSEP